MHIFQNLINDLFDVRTETSEISSQHQNDTFKSKYYKYKKKYLDLKFKLENQQVGGNINKPEGGFKFDIYIAGQTNPKNIFQKANIKEVNGKYFISLNLPVYNMGPVSYPIVLQNNQVYSTAEVNGERVIRFKYKDDNNIRTIEFKYNSFLRKRFSVIRGSEVLNLMR